MNTKKQIRQYALNIHFLELDLPNNLITDDELISNKSKDDEIEVDVVINSDNESKKEKKSKESNPEMSDVREIFVQVYISCAAQINECDGEQYFDKLYGSIKTNPIEVPGSPFQYTHAVKFTLFDKNETERQQLITLVSRLKANIFAIPFHFVASLVKDKSRFSPFEIAYRGSTGESVYITPTDKGAAATYCIRFSDEGDKIVGGVFFQELTAARQRVPSAPAVSYSNDPPSDLSAFNLPTRDQKLFAYVTVSLQDAQLSDRKIETVGYYMPLFRDYLHYHIKCAKAFMHQKMRARTASMLKILNDAKPEPKHKVKRTITGKIIS